MLYQAGLCRLKWNWQLEAVACWRMAGHYCPGFSPTAGNLGRKRGGITANHKDRKQSHPFRCRPVGYGLDQNNLLQVSPIRLASGHLEAVSRYPTIQRM